MADMDLREVLVSAMDAVDCPHEEWDCLRCQADAALARLSQPDVLDEFERRMGTRVRPLVPERIETAARRALSDMLGGGS